MWRRGDQKSHKLGENREIQRKFESFQAAPDPFADTRQTTERSQTQETTETRPDVVRSKTDFTTRRVTERLASKLKTRLISTWICIGVTTITTLVAFIVQRRGLATFSFTDFTIGSAIYLISGLSLIGSIIFASSFLHAFWSAIPLEFARANPNEAVAFLFIPGFGIYWIFQALYGGAVDADEALKTCAESENDEKGGVFVSPGWALATSVFFDLGGPFNPVSGLFFLLSLGVTTVQMKNVALKLDSLNAARSKTDRR